MDIILLIFIVIIGFIFLNNKLSQPHTPTRNYANINTPIEVVGESFYQSNIAAILTDANYDHGRDSANYACKAKTVPDNNNPHDKNAVKVEINGKTVGHLSRDYAKAYRKAYGLKSIECNAIITGGFKKHGEKASYGVKLFD
jgi:hypothetical protein